MARFGLLRLGQSHIGIIRSSCWLSFDLSVSGKHRMCRQMLNNIFGIMNLVLLHILWNHPRRQVWRLVSVRGLLRLGKGRSTSVDVSIFIIRERFKTPESLVFHLYAFFRGQQRAKLFMPKDQEGISMKLEQFRRLLDIIYASLKRCSVPSG